MDYESKREFVSLLDSYAAHLSAVRDDDPSRIEPFRVTIADSV